MPVSSSSTRYRRAAPMDPEEQAEAESKKIRAERIDKILAKIHAVVWVLTSIVLFIVTDTAGLLHSSDKINRCGSIPSHPIADSLLSSPLQGGAALGRRELLRQPGHLLLFNAVAARGEEHPRSLGCVLP